MTAAPWLERFARVGYAAKALLYGTVGMLAIGAAFGHGRSADTRGAMTTLLHAPFGRMLLALVAVGLFGYAAWRCTSAILDAERRGTDAKGLAIRAGFLARGIAHLALGVTAARLAFGQSSGDGNPGERATGYAMDVPGGAGIVWLAAIAVGGFGLFQLYRALTAKLSQQLRQGEARAEAGGWVIAVSRFGIAARAFVLLAIASLLGRAAASHDASRAGGIADALDALGRLGRWPYAAIGGGLIAYGVYQLVNARYRQIVASG